MASEIQFTDRDNEIIDTFKLTYNALYLKSLEGNSPQDINDKIESIKLSANLVQKILIHNLQNQIQSKKDVPFSDHLTIQDILKDHTV